MGIQQKAIPIVCVVFVCAWVFVFVSITFTARLQPLKEMKDNDLEDAQLPFPFEYMPLMSSLSGSLLVHPRCSRQQWMKNVFLHQKKRWDPIRCRGLALCNMIVLLSDAVGVSNVCGVVAVVGFVIDKLRGDVDVT